MEGMEGGMNPMEEISGAELAFFDGRMDALPLYERLAGRILADIPDTSLKVQKTQITFTNRRVFACVSFQPARRAKARPKPFLTVSFGLAYRLDALRIDAAAEPYPNRWTHHVTLGSVAEVDDELMGWLVEAAAFSAAK